MDAVLHALSDESRRTVLEVLRDHPATAGELAALLPIARPGVSRHLRVLRDAGLVEVRQQAQWRVYGLCPGPLAEVDVWLGRYRSLRSPVASTSEGVRNDRHFQVVDPRRGRDAISR
jgi:DNA-binding transcriptional ArsR family regulator